MIWFLQCFKKFADFDGRAQREEFWCFILFHFSTVALLFFLLTLVPSTLTLAIFYVYVLVALLPNIAVNVRRLHDTDRSGWWTLIGLIPIFGLILLFFFCLNGQSAKNRYGENPKEVYGTENTPNHLVLILIAAIGLACSLATNVWHGSAKHITYMAPQNIFYTPLKNTSIKPAQKVDKESQEFIECLMKARLLYPEPNGPYDDLFIEWKCEEVVTGNQNIETPPDIQTPRYIEKKRYPSFAHFLSDDKFMSPILSSIGFLISIPLLIKVSLWLKKRIGKENKGWLRLIITLSFIFAVLAASFQLQEYDLVALEPYLYGLLGFIISFFGLVFFRQTYLWIIDGFKED